MKTKVTITLEDGDEPGSLNMKVDFTPEITEETDSIAARMASVAIQAITDAAN